MNIGKAISLCNDQHWLLEDSFARVAAENLLAFYQAALLLDLDSTQIEGIFCRNACSLFDVSFPCDSVLPHPIYPMV